MGGDTLEGAALLYHHTHTPVSNTDSGGNHHGDYTAMRDALPAAIDLVMVRTEHETVDEAFYDDLEAELEGTYDAAVERYETHLHADTRDGRLTVINGVETAVEEAHQHVTLAGLPIEDTTYEPMERQELYEAAKDAAWVSPAHPKMPTFVWPDTLLDDVFTSADREGFTAAVNYSTGYTPLLNRCARGTLFPHTTSVHDYAGEHDIGLVPELDLHAAIPAKGEGAGLLDPGTVDALAEGDMPAEELLSARVVSYGREGLSTREFLASFPDTPSMLPGYTRTVRKILPAESREFEQVHADSIASLEDVSVEELWANSYDPQP